MSKKVICIHQQAFDHFRFNGAYLGSPKVEALAHAVLHHGTAHDRSFADCQPGDPRYRDSFAWKQLATYGVVRHGGKVLTYSRVADHDRPELATLRSLGIGGHVEPSDLGPVDSVPELVEALHDAVGRELAEEVPEAYGSLIRVAGLVNDDTHSPHHLGILYAADCEHLDPQIRGCPELIDPRFDAPEEIDPGTLEPWSRLVLPLLLAGLI